MDEWYEELDFEENPFSVNPSDFLKNLVNREDIIDELDYRIRSGSLVFMEGPRGSGRTSILRAIIKRFRGRGRVIYVNAEKFEKKLDIEELLVKRNGLVKGMFLKKKPKKMILLMDNVDSLSHRNTERLKHYFDENYLQTVVFTGTSFEKAGFSESLKLRIEGRVITIPDMTDNEIIQMVRGRIGDSKLISDEVVLEVARRYDNNPKEILKALDEVAEFVTSLDEEVITLKHIDEVLDTDFSDKTTKSSETSVSREAKGAANTVDDKDSKKSKPEEPEEDNTDADEIVSELETFGDSEESSGPVSPEKSEGEEKAKQGASADNEAPVSEEEDLDDIDAFFDEVEEDNIEESKKTQNAASGNKKEEDVNVDSEDASEEPISKEAQDDEKQVKAKQNDLDKHVMIEEEAVSDKDDQKDVGEVFDDDFFLDEDDDKNEDHSEDDDIFDEFFEDDEEEK
ncbi:MAG: AAA family ATPase [Candidatus Woesearchaeota archaeon]